MRTSPYIKQRKGKLIVIDGIDGSGKATQVELLVKALKEEKVSVRTIDFPRYYDNLFGELVGECLRGEHGGFVELSPKVASVLTAADRFETKEILNKWLDAGHVVVTDRYASSNQIHQGGKIKDARARGTFLEWLNRLEYEVFKIPRPDLVIFLDVPAPVSQRLLAHKDMRQKKRYLQGKKDVAEESVEHLESSRKSARWVMKHDVNWHLVRCSKRDTMRPRESIHAEVWDIVMKHLRV